VGASRTPVKLGTIALLAALLVPLAAPVAAAEPTSGPLPSTVPSPSTSSSTLPSSPPICSDGNVSLETRPSTTPAERPDRVTGRWRTIPPAPHPGGDGHTLTWTGRELIVWGGEGGRIGAAWNPDRNAWRRIADAPIPGRSGHSAVWTGSELIVWGGARRSGRRVDGAAYDPRRDRWRVIRNAPGPGRWKHASAWTGTEMLVVGGAGPEESTLGGVAYDPVADTWRSLPSSDLPPGDEGGTHAQVAAWTGDDLLVVSYPGGTGARAMESAYVPSTDAWTRRGTLDLASLSEPDATWTGTELLLVGPSTGPTWLNDTPDGLGIPSSIAYDPDAACQRPTTYPRGSGGATGQAVWTGRLLLFYGLAYDPVTDTWLRFPRASKGRGARQFASTALAGDEYVMWAGAAVGEAYVPLNDGIAFLPDDEWRPEEAAAEGQDRRP
jgi:hypothetical protein